MAGAELGGEAARAGAEMGSEAARAGAEVGEAMESVSRLPHFHLSSCSRAPMGCAMCL